jgi:putative DNA primase/helicase
LLALSNATIALGKPASAASVPKDEDEFRKAITSALREGQAAINLDNIVRPLSSPDLAKCITEPTFQDRLLGENTTLHLPTNVFWTATGNNLSFGDDLDSRVVLCKIDAEEERPEERPFKITDLKKYLLENRQRIVVAVLTILRAFHDAGRPDQNLKRWGGFEQWSAMIREPLVWAGCEDPYETRKVVFAEDSALDNTADVLSALRGVFKDEHFTLSHAVSRAKELGGEALLTALMKVASSRTEQIDQQRLGWWARRNRDRIIGDLKLRRVNESRPALWRVDQSTHDTQSTHASAVGNEK